MFELPLSTTLLLVGFPLFWIAYTIVFLWRTRRWENDDRREGRDRNEDE